MRKSERRVASVWAVVRGIADASGRSAAPQCRLDEWLRPLAAWNPLRPLMVKFGIIKKGRGGAAGSKRMVCDGDSCRLVDGGACGEARQRKGCVATSVAPPAPGEVGVISSTEDLGALIADGARRPRDPIMCTRECKGVRTVASASGQQGAVVCEAHPAPPHTDRPLPTARSRIRARYGLACACAQVRLPACQRLWTLARRGVAPASVLRRSSHGSLQMRARRRALCRLTWTSARAAPRPAASGHCRHSMRTTAGRSALERASARARCAATPRSPAARYRLTSSQRVRCVVR